jgi:hypothetical protein
MELSPKQIISWGTKQASANIRKQKSPPAFYLITIMKTRTEQKKKTNK